jgi:hypothetical protein
MCADCCQYSWLCCGLKIKRITRLIKNVFVQITLKTSFKWTGSENKHEYSCNSVKLFRRLPMTCTLLAFFGSGLAGTLTNVRQKRTGMLTNEISQSVHLRKSMLWMRVPFERLHVEAVGRQDGGGPSRGGSYCAM